MGKEMTPAQFTRLVDQHEQTFLSRGHDGADKYLARKFGNKAAEVKAMITGYNESGLPLTMGIIEKRGGQGKDHYAQPTEETVMRSEIAEAFADTASKDHHTREALVESEISAEYLESPEIHGDFARAFAAHDSAVDKLERESPDTQYNETELAESAEEGNHAYI